MATQQARTAAKLQPIPTNVDERSSAVPPKGLQDNITPNELFYVRNHWKGAPEFDVNTYRLVVDGEVERPLQLSLQDIRELPENRFQVTFECCGNSPVPDYWARATRTSSTMEQVKGHGIMGNAEWAGVSVADLLSRAGVKASAVEVLFEGADHGPDETVGDPPNVTYERSLPLAKATHTDTLLAYEMNGEPLPPLHGYPLRLVVPGWFGMTSIKWLVGIHVLDHEFKGFYQTERYMTVNGPDAESYYTYHTQQIVKSIITNPVPGEVIPSGGYLLAGAAWSGEEEVVKVDISTDGAATWSPVDTLKPRSGYSWYRWEHHWQPPGPGRYTLMSRASNKLGEAQPMEFPNKWDGRGYANNMVFPFEVEVR